MEDTTRDSTNSRAKWIVGGLVLVALAFGTARISGNLFNTGASNDVLGRGSNSNLQLGGENKNFQANALSPLRLSKETADQDYISVKAGHYHTLLLTRSGTVYAMGGNAQHAVSASGKPMIGTPSRVSFPGLANGEVITQVDSSRDHNIALTSAGRVYTWGSNYTGQLGDGTNNSRGTPKPVKGLPAATTVTAGYRHSAVITKAGEIYSWGGSCSEQALSEAQVMISQALSSMSALGGYGSTKQSDLKSHDIGDCATQKSTFVQSKTPRKLAGISGKPTALSAGYGHLLVLTDDGAVYSGGCNTYGQLGRAKAAGAKQNDMARIDLPGKAMQLAAGFRHSAVLLEGGKAWAWGYNGDGSALHIGQSGEVIRVPAEVATDYVFTSLEAAHDTTFGVSTNGRIVGWGQDDAQAFWKTEAAADISVLGGEHRPAATLSAGMRHLLLLEQSKKQP